MNFLFIWWSKNETVVIIFLIVFIFRDFRFWLWFFIDLLKIVLLSSDYLYKLVLIRHCTLHFFLLCLVPLVQFFSEFLNWIRNYLVVFLLARSYVFSLIIIIIIIIRLIKLTLCSTKVRPEQAIIYQKGICWGLAEP